MKMVDSTFRFEGAKRSIERLLCLLFLSAFLGACRPPAPAVGQGGLMEDTERFLTSGRKFDSAQRSDLSLEALEAEADKHIKVVQSLGHLDLRMREFEVGRVYTILRMIARIKGPKQKEVEFERKAVEALQRAGFPGPTSTMVDAVEKGLGSPRETPGGR